jgi:hypothetical protein
MPVHTLPGCRAVPSPLTSGTGSLDPGRLLFLDWLRIGAFAVLVLYHVGMYYVTWDFHVKSPFADRTLEPWMRLVEPWRMSLLFMVSGAVTAHMLGSASAAAVLRRRSRQLLLPLLCGVVLIVPPQAYVEVLRRFAYTGSYADFLVLYFSGHAGFCRDGACLILPTWNHLWFLPYLWLYTLLLCATLALRPDALASVARATSLLRRDVALLALPVLWVLVLRLVLLGHFPVTHALWNDPFAHLLYGSMFGAGAVFALVPGLWDRMAALRWPALLLALDGWAASVWLVPAGPLAQAAIAVQTWCALVAAFGFARRHLDVDARPRALLTEAVFPLYLVHQTVIVVGSQLMLPLGWRPRLEGPMLIVATVAIGFAVHGLVRRLGPLRPWFGLRPRVQVGIR